MVVRVLPLITALLPITAIHVSLLVAINADVIPACFPYIDGCTSISATGRYEPASFIFKPAMLSSWVILVLYWLYNVAWLRAWSQQLGDMRPLGRPMAMLGITGAIALILYTTFLGTQAPIYEFMRRIGIYFYFGCTVIAQIILARNTLRLAAKSQVTSVTNVGRAQMAIALVPFFLGALNLVLKNTLADPDPVENVIEWIFALLMHVFFLLTFFAWRATGFDGRFTVLVNKNAA